MKPTEQTSETDAVSDLPFQTVSTSETTLKERLYRRADRSLLAPFRIIWNDWRGKVGLSLIILYILMGTVGPHLFPEPLTDIEHQLVGPFETWQYPLGTDQSGRGMLAQVVYATPPMLKMVLAGGVFAVLLGSAIGMIAGYKGGYVDYALMIVTDTLMTLPGLPLIIVLAFLVDPESPYIIGVLIAINAWTGLARAIRSQMLPLRNIEYVEANRLMGIPTWKILLKDITPNLAPYIAVNFVMASRQIIFDSVALYFLGVLPTQDPNWGVMMDQAYSSGGALYSWDAAHWIIVPGLAVVGFSFGLILFAQAADKLFNPRIRARHQKTTRTGDEEEESAEPETTTKSATGV